MTRSKDKAASKPDRANPISRSSGKGGERGPAREISQVERDGVPSTDTDARTPLGVGESFGRRGENIGKQEGKEPGRRDAGTTGQAKRPAGESTGRDATTINPHDEP